MLQMPISLGRRVDRSCRRRGKRQVNCTRSKLAFSSFGYIPSDVSSSTRIFSKSVPGGFRSASTIFFLRTLFAYVVYHVTVSLTPDHLDHELRLTEGFAKRLAQTSTGHTVWSTEDRSSQPRIGTCPVPVLEPTPGAMEEPRGSVYRSTNFGAFSAGR